MSGSQGSQASAKGERYPRSGSAKVRVDSGYFSHGERRSTSTSDTDLKSDSTGAGKPEFDAESKKTRLLILSSKVKNVNAVVNAVLSTVFLVQYKYENSSFEGILSQISQRMGSKMVESIALVVHSSLGSIFLVDNKENLSASKFTEQQGLKSFFKTLISKHLESSNNNSRLDFLGCGLINSDRIQITKQLESFLEINVGISKDILGNDIEFIKSDENSKSLIGELYFRTEKLRSWSAQPQTLAGFEKIRTVGKGAYGAAVLYRKKDDDSLVILKEINMHDLNASERQLALNEVKVLSMLDHPNIISYYDSFEEDGTLMIEMEYADGGTLAQYLSNLDNKEIPEKDILLMFQQMVSALNHIHENNILHRDLKTANIFLTREGMIKLGDFGISKMMTSVNRGANTVLGTPYYISPEICEGKPYNDKSDIWALGCILYEMACQQKTFEGSNLPALVNKIMKGQFEPIKGNYSAEFKRLVEEMLQQEPEYRPPATAIYYVRLPPLLQQWDTTSETEDDLMTSADSATHRKQKSRSVLYYFDNKNMSLLPTDLPSRIKIRQVATSSKHTVVVSYERAVYSWGEGGKGQLGHGDLVSKNKPVLIETLKGKSIIKACCGDGFTVFSSDNGIVMTCGDGSKGCLGHGDWIDALKPRLIESLLCVDVSAIDCGAEHVVAASTAGEVFSWGQGTEGQLGLGEEETSCCQPIQITMDKHAVQDVRCGLNNTMFLADSGFLLACGSNENNKIGLNNRQTFLMAMRNLFTKTDVAGASVPTIVRDMTRHKVKDMVLGPHHSLVILESGLIYAFGRNNEGQLGLGTTKLSKAPVIVKEIDNLNKPVTMASCGEYFTVVGTCYNEVYIWGKAFTPATTSQESSKGSSVESGKSDHGHASHSRNPSTASVTSLAGQPNGEAPIANSASKTEKDMKVPPKRIDSASSNQSKKSVSSQSGISSSEKETKDDNISEVFLNPKEDGIVKSHSNNDLKGGGGDDSMVSGSQDRVPQTILVPVPILYLDSGDSSSDKVERFPVTLNGLLCHGDNLYVQVETTAPAPRKPSKRKKRKLLKKLSDQNLKVPQEDPSLSASSRDGYTSSEASELDNTSIPTWIKKEMQESEITVEDEADISEEEADMDDDQQELAPLKASVMPKITINKEMKQDALNGGELKISAEKSTSDIKRKEIRVASKRIPASDIRSGNEVAIYARRKHHNSASSESGVDIASSDAAAPYSTDSSYSDNRPRPTMSHHSPRLAAKRDSSIRPATVSSSRGTSSPYKQQKGVSGSVVGQRPLNRLRAGRGRPFRPQTSNWTLDGQLRDTGNKTEKDSQQGAALQGELEKLKAAKEDTENKLREIQDAQQQQQQHMLVEMEKITKEREQYMKEEIEQLRKELNSRSNKLQENYNVVRSLQDQLKKLQIEQNRGNRAMSADASHRHRRTSSTSSKNSGQVSNSKVCIVQ